LPPVLVCHAKASADHETDVTSNEESCSLSSLETVADCVIGEPTASSDWQLHRARPTPKPSARHQHLHGSS